MQDSPVSLSVAASATRDFDIVGRGMAQWRRERPDIDCSGKAVVGRILRLQEVILRAANASLERHGLRYSAYAVLATLRASGPPFRMSPSRLQETLLLTSGGTSNLLARLEKKGWISRLADPLDGRAIIVELSEEGRLLADRAMADHAATERQLVNMLSKDEQSVLSELLSRMLVMNGNPTTWIPDGPVETAREPDPTGSKQVRSEADSQRPGPRAGGRSSGRKK